MSGNFYVPYLLVYIAWVSIGNPSIFLFVFVGMFTRGCFLFIPRGEVAAFPPFLR